MSSPAGHDTESVDASTLLPTASGHQARAAVWALLADRRGLLAGASAALVGAAGAGLVAPLALGAIVDVVTEHRGVGALWSPVAVLAVVAVLAAGLGMVGTILVSRAGEPALADLREQVMGRALALPSTDLERAGSGDLLARVVGDVDLVADAVSDVIPTLASSGLTIALTVVGLAALDWRFALAGLCALPIEAHTVRWYLRTSGPVYAAERVAEGDQAQQLLDSIGGAATVRALGLGDEHRGGVERRSRAVVDLALVTTRLRTRFYGRLNLAELVGLTMVLVTGFVLVRHHEVTIGAATAAALYFARLFDPINELLILADDAQDAAAGLARLVGITQLPPPDEPSRPRQPDGWSLALESVDFAYQPGHDVLHEIDLTVAAGERVALVGATGAGKSTVAKLLAGLHHPRRGRVTIGGVPVEALSRTQLDATVALVTQEIHTFAGPLADDLRLARPEATDDQLHEALDAVGATGWVARLDRGLDTVVGHGGHRLTATQAQQVALARVALADRPVVILDEATAEAGSSGARALEVAGARVLGGRTAVVVAHRLTQAAAADRVVVLDRGRVVEEGRHAELVAAGGTYSQLWAAWTANRTTSRPVDQWAMDESDCSKPSSSTSASP